MSDNKNNLHSDRPFELSIFLITIGISIFLTCFPVAQNYHNEYNRQSRFFASLAFELSHNSFEANVIHDGYVKKSVIITNPLFQTTAYDAGVETGDIYALNPVEFRSLDRIYTSIHRWNKLDDFALSQAEPDGMLSKSLSDQTITIQKQLSDLRFVHTPTDDLDTSFKWWGGAMLGLLLAYIGLIRYSFVKHESGFPSWKWVRSGIPFMLKRKRRITK